MPSGQEIQLNAKQVLGFFGALIACMVGAATIHSMLVVPAIMSEVRDLMDEEMAKHSTRPHPTGASRDDVRDIIVRLGSLATKDDVAHLLERIKDLSDRVRRLETDGK